MTDSNTSSIDLREHARKRPGMYIGGIDTRALHQLFFEALEHAIDEAAIGRCDQIGITLLPDNQVVIEDNSLGLPMIHVNRENMSMMEAVLERSGIFRDPHGEYEATGSSFGVGLRGSMRCRRKCAWRIGTTGSYGQKAIMKDWPTALYSK